MAKGEITGGECKGLETGNAGKGAGGGRGTGFLGRAGQKTGGVLLSCDLRASPQTNPERSQGDLMTLDL